MNTNGRQVRSLVGAIPEAAVRLESISLPLEVAGLQDLKDQLKIEHTFEDDYLLALLKSATVQVENLISRLVQSRKVMAQYRDSEQYPSILLDDGVAGMDLSDPEWNPPADSFQATAIDADGERIDITDADWQYAISSDTSLTLWIRGGWGASYMHCGRFLAITYKPKAIIDDAIAHAIIMVAAGSYENRESEGIIAVQKNPALVRLLAPYKRHLSWRGWRND